MRFHTLSMGAAAIDSLPPADDRLFGPHAYGAGWLVVGVVAVLTAVALAAWSLRPAPRSPVAATAPPPPLRQRYLEHLDDLEQRFASRQVDGREVHHELSRTLRRFAVDVGTTRATSMSAGQLDDAGQGAVATAVRRYELPQFAWEVDRDPLAAIDLARAVIVDADADDEVRSG